MGKLSPVCTEQNKLIVIIDYNVGKNKKQLGRNPPQMPIVLRMVYSWSLTETKLQVKFSHSWVQCTFHNIEDLTLQSCAQETIKTKKLEKH